MNHHHDDDDFSRNMHRAWRQFQAAGRRGWGGWGGWGGPGGPGRGWGGFGDEFRIGRMLASGDLRLIALYFIQTQQQNRGESARERDWPWHNRPRNNQRTGHKSPA